MRLVDVGMRFKRPLIPIGFPQNTTGTSLSIGQGNRIAKFGIILSARNPNIALHSDFLQRILLLRFLLDVVGSLLSTGISSLPINDNFVSLPYYYLRINKIRTSNKPFCLYQAYEEPTLVGKTSLPYIKNVTDRVGKTLKGHHVSMAYRPIRKLQSMFALSKIDKKILVVDMIICNRN